MANDKTTTLGSLLAFLRKSNVSAWKNGVEYSGDDAMLEIYTAFGVRPMTRWERIKFKIAKFFRRKPRPEVKQEDILTPANVGTHLERRHQFVMLNHPTRKLYQRGFIQIEVGESLFISNGMSDKATQIGIDKQEIETAIKYFQRI